MTLDQELRRLFDEGLSVAGVAARLDVPEAVVEEWLERNNDVEVITEGEGEDTERPSCGICSRKLRQGEKTQLLHERRCKPDQPAAIGLVDPTQWEDPEPAVGHRWQFPGE